MTGAGTKGLGADRLASLQAWLVRQGVEVEGELTASLITGGMSNLTYVLADEAHQWILRRPPLAGATPSAHDVGREYRVTRALESTAVPVAATVAESSDPTLIGSPFTIVEFVSGRAVRTAADLDLLGDDAVDGIVDSLVGALAALHRVDHVEVGLADFGRPHGYASRQVRRWSGQWEVVGAHASPAAAIAAEEVVRRLRSAVPTEQQARIVHGDYRIDNTLLDVDTGEVNAIVDWELSTIGDPVADVALMCVYRAPTLDAILGFDAAWTSPRLPAPDQLAARYLRAGGAELTDWEFWMALSSFKLAVIAAGIDYRWRSGTTVGGGFDTAGQAVGPLLEQALEYTGLIVSRLP